MTYMAKNTETGSEIYFTEKSCSVSTTPLEELRRFIGRNAGGKWIAYREHPSKYIWVKNGKPIFPRWVPVTLN